MIIKLLKLAGNHPRTFIGIDIALTIITWLISPIAGGILTALGVYAILLQNSKKLFKGE